MLLDLAKAELTLRKLDYVTEIAVIVSDNCPVGAFFPTIASYQKFLADVLHGNEQDIFTILQNMPDHTEIDGVLNIAETGNFVQLITGSFSSRYFNSLTGDEYRIVKRSKNKEKIKAEYNFYHLLPEDMQFWFVEPFNYKEKNEIASYEMERLHIPDLAVKWVQGSIDLVEMEDILNKYFYFFASRKCRSVDCYVSEKIRDNLFLNKVKSRLEELKTKQEFSKLTSIIAVNGGVTIDSLFQRYLALKNKLETQRKDKIHNSILVIGHGDPCFSNTLYSKTARILKFIDPKGALTENDLWTDPYYDIAKLSHSICGRYDFFNSEMFRIELDKRLQINLLFDFNNKKFVDLFRRKLEEAGYDYWLVRLYEVSLFLSMLPLHIDNPQKVLGFIFNAMNILQEIEENV